MGAPHNTKYGCQNRANKISALANMASTADANGELFGKRRRMEDLNKVTVVLGAQWGDEGKGKIVDMLAQTADVVCRCQVKHINRTVVPTAATD